MRIPFFRIFYSTTFTILALIFLVLLLITPGDAIVQAYQNNQIYNVFVIAGVYLLVFLVSILIYSVRIFTNRSHLSSIPRSWIPIEKGDVRKDVRHMIMEALERSAKIAWRAYPKDLREVTATQSAGQVDSTRDIPEAIVDPTKVQSSEVADLSEKVPTWGAISHPGWSSPSAQSLANLHFETIILELPHLIEAKAVSLTPLPIAVTLLRRPIASSCGTYISQLTSLGVLFNEEDESVGQEFLSSYERARFAGKALTEDEFQALMAIFARLLHSIQPLSEDALAELEPTPLASPGLPPQDGSSSSWSFVSPSSSDSSPDPPLSRPPLSSSSASHSSSTNSLQTTATVEHHPNPTSSNERRPGSRPRRRRAEPVFHTPIPDIARFSTPNTASYYDVSEGSLAGSEGTVERNVTSRGRSGSQRLGSSKGMVVDEKAKKVNHDGENRREETGLGLHMSRSKGSESGSAGSVIRLAEAAGPLDLPYVITVEE